MKYTALLTAVAFALACAPACAVVVGNQAGLEAAKDDKSKDADKDQDKGKKVIPYPLDTCLVTDNKLGSMGDPVTLIHEGRELKFCCSPCVDKFQKDPAKYLGKLEKPAE